MPLTHYPKTSDNLVFAWVLPAPPDVEPVEGLPDFLGRPFSELNRWTSSSALKSNESLVGFHDAQPFTRFYGSIACDQLLDISLTFSNDEVDSAGYVVCDDNLSKLNYDAHGVRQLYDPKRQEQTGKLFTMIFGRWIRIEIKSVGDQEPTYLRVYIRGSVF